MQFEVGVRHTWLRPCTLALAGHAVWQQVMHVGAGGVILKAVGLPLRHDLYCALVGAYALWGLSLLGIRLVNISRRAGDAAVLSEAAAYCAVVARLGLLSCLGLVVVPLLAGLYLDMVMLPLRCALWGLTMNLRDELQPAPNICTSSPVFEHSTCQL